MQSDIEKSSLEDLRAWAREIMQRKPDFVIGQDPENEPYMRRWWAIPRNPFQNVYLHEILKSDDDRAGHDHPWHNRTLVLEGEYLEQTYLVDKPWIADGEPRLRVPGDVIERSPEMTHRLIVPDGGRAVSLFFTGPVVRSWGFWCPGVPASENAERVAPRWVHWKDFTDPDNAGKTGPGCGE